MILPKIWHKLYFGYYPYARSGWNSGNFRNGAYYRKIDTQFEEIEIQVPRDRNGKFHQHTLPDYKQMVPKIEAYHKRSLSDKFFCVYLDATYLPLHRQTF